MAKNTRQCSGVVAGAMDISMRTRCRPAPVTSAGYVLARRQRAARRAKHLTGRRAAARAAVLRVAPASVALARLRPQWLFTFALALTGGLLTWVGLAASLL